MKTVARTERRRAWLAIGIADVVFLILILGLVQRWRDGMLDDPGLGWHLRTIDAMIAAGGWLTTDPFSGPRGGQPWLGYQWLGDLALWLGWRWAGLEGIAAVTTLVIACTIRGLFRALITDGVPWPAALVWTLIGALGTSIGWVARPNLFTILFVFWTARVCERLHSGQCRLKGALWLLPVFVVWANMHGGFLAGLLLLGVAAGAEFALAVLISEPGKRLAARQRAVQFALLFFAAAACTLINPYGIELHRWVLKLLLDPYFMNLNVEWRSPDFHAQGAFRYELLMLLIPIVLSLSRSRPSVMTLTLVVVSLHMALNGQRYIPLFVVISVPLLARTAVGIDWSTLYAPRFRVSNDVRDLLRRAPASNPIVASVIVAVSLLLWARFVKDRKYAAHDPEHIPTTALERLLRRHAGRVVFHHVNWGGWLIWHGWPAGFRSTIDDRNELFGRELFEEHFAVLQSHTGWETVLTRLQAELVCVPPSAPLAHRLTERAQGRDADWHEIYRDRQAVLFERIRPASTTRFPSP
jgi:hypothetical protein